MDMVRDNWTFFSNHGHVYFILALENDVVVREIASKVGLTERAVLTIIQDLEDAGYIKREKIGRTNKYIVEADKTLRHPLEKTVKLTDLTKIIKKSYN